ncbi:hypothetical protein ABZP36_036212 [Zizania latifolia]
MCCTVTICFVYVKEENWTRLNLLPKLNITILCLAVIKQKYLWLDEIEFVAAIEYNNTTCGHQKTEIPLAEQWRQYVDMGKMLIRSQILVRSQLVFLDFFATGTAYLDWYMGW